MKNYCVHTLGHINLVLKQTSGMCPSQFLDKSKDVFLLVVFICGILVLYVSAQTLTEVVTNGTGIKYPDWIFFI
jgi:hypothetical protein